jgi:ATP-dependent DNA helicase RecQ
MDEREFQNALGSAIKFFPGIQVKEEQIACLRSLVVKGKDVLAVLPTGFGKSLIYQLLPKLYSSYWLEKYREVKIFQIVVVSPLEQIRKQQVERLIERGISAACLEDLKCEEKHSDKEILFGSAESWLSDSWRTQLTTGSLKDVHFLVVNEVHTVETW